MGFYSMMKVALEFGDSFYALMLDSEGAKVMQVVLSSTVMAQVLFL